VAGSYHTEVALVEGRDRGLVELLSDCNQAGVDAAETLVGVLLGQLGNAIPVGAGELLEDELAIGDRPIQSSFGGWPELAVE
jgi:hypothetical protein